ncbi:cell wall-active antibiotics response protein LiaF [Alteribacter aurantiacus]|uniref:cell wall-active antibiotics response protein LiaF n=1 Tax=Alteribacter aurantiacus TaxID=254410 RepID=UPI00040F8C59|nr:cell wall-active antibiotics response protein LiaF [Alteribacter aurantiacus]
MNKTIGMIILAIGILYLLNNTGVIEASFGQMVSTYWPLIFVVVGLKILFDGIFRAYQGLKRDKWDFGTVFFGLIVIAIGVILTGNRAGLFYYTLADLWSWTWPLIIIFVGFQLLRSNTSSVKVDFSKDDDDWNEEHSKKQSKKKPYNSEDFGEYIQQTVEKTVEEATSSLYNWDDEKVKKEQRKRSKTNQHKHGGDYSNVRLFVGEVVIGKNPWTLENSDIRATIGSVEVDLTTAVLKEGDNYLDISMWIGSVEITVPKDMAIQAHVGVSLGDATLFDDNVAGTGRNATYTSENFYEAEHRVILNVRNSIGSVEVMAVD